MQRILGVRILSWYLKLAYVAGVWIAGFLVISLFDALGTPIVGSVANTLLLFAGVILGARWFRGKSEPIAPPRPWWKMTARRTLSRVVGIVALLGVVSTVVVVLGAAIGFDRYAETLTRITLPDAIVIAATYGVLAFLYLNSAARLPKPPPRTREPNLGRRIKLD